MLFRSDDKYKLDNGDCVEEDNFYPMTAFDDSGVELKKGIMASLKEIKVRIASIRSTQKITAAMKMVSSAKLHHTQTLTEHTLLYANKLSSILNGLLDAECDLESPYTEKREVKQVVIAVFSSSSGLCGTFNANVWKELSARLHELEAQH